MSEDIRSPDHDVSQGNLEASEVPSNVGLVLDALARLPEKTLLDQKALAVALAVTDRTVRRMVQRGELPPPVRLSGRSTWLSGRILDWIEADAAKAEQDAKRHRKRLKTIDPSI